MENRECLLGVHLLDFGSPGSAAVYVLLHDEDALVE